MSRFTDVNTSSITGGLETKREENDKPFRAVGNASTFRKRSLFRPQDSLCSVKDVPNQYRNMTS